MNNNLKIAKQLIGLAKSLIASEDEYPEGKYLDNIWSKIQDKYADFYLDMDFFERYSTELKAMDAGIEIGGWDFVFEICYNDGKNLILKVFDCDKNVSNYNVWEIKCTENELINNVGIGIKKCEEVVKKKASRK